MHGDDFLDLETKLIERLKDVLPPSMYVLSAADLAGTEEARQPTPAVHVLYRDYTPTYSATGAFVGIEQLWLTVVAVRHVGDLDAGTLARREAGPFAGRIIRALSRHKFPGHKPLRLGSAPAAGFSNGHFYLPIGWICPMNLRSDACESI